MEIISRSEAKAAGLTRYFTGRPCKRGHVCERNVCSNVCTECGRDVVRKYKEANPEKVREQKRKYYEANSEKVSEYHRKYYEANSEKVREQSRKYYEANSEKVREGNRKYREQTKRNESALDTLALLANLSKLKEMDNV